MKMKLKLCGLSRPQDIEAANALMPDYVGFVFARKSRRYISPETAAALRNLLHPGIQAVGVFTDEKPELVAALVRDHIIDVIQLHGHEDRDYISYLRTLTSAPIIQAVCIRDESDLERAQESSADLILLDSAAGGSGVSFDWSILSRVTRPYFLAGECAGRPNCHAPLRSDRRGPLRSGCRSSLRSGRRSSLRRGRELRHRDGWMERQNKNGTVCARGAERHGHEITQIA